MMKYEPPAIQSFNKDYIGAGGVCDAGTGAIESCDHGNNTTGVHTPCHNGSAPEAVCHNGKNTVASGTCSMGTSPDSQCINGSTV